MDQKKNNSLTIALMTTAISFALFVFAIKIVHGSNIDLSNIFAYLLASSIFGLVAAIFSRLSYRIGLWIYLASLLFGFIVMINTFSKHLSGWEDLAAVISLFMIVGIGFGVALVVVLIQYLMNRNK